MGVQTLADIRSFNDYIRSKLLKRVASLPPEMLTWRPAPERWSAAEHVEHLALAEEVYIRWLTRLVQEGRERGLAGQPKTVDAIPELLKLTDRLEAPAEMVPEGRPVEESLARLTASREQINRFYGQLAELETDQITVPFRTVRLNAAQLMHLVGIHEHRHERHLGALAEAWGSRQG
ncbi:MAG: DinB family protein [Bacillota bacterium]